MAKVYLHIGLPKTATTSLQLDFFPFIDSKDYFYAGVNQPRKANSSELYYLLNKVVASGENVELVKSEVLKVIEQGKSLVVSDEMFLVSSLSVSWQVKIERLLNVFEGFEFKVLVTVREPAKAMFSFYAEMYTRYSNLTHDWVWLAENNNDFKIYHYEYLLEFLNQRVAGSKIKVCKFEDIVSGDLSGIDDFMDFPKMDAPYNGVTKRNNKETRLNDGAVSVSVTRKSSIRSFIAGFFRRVKLGEVVVTWGWKIWKFLGLLKNDQEYLARPTEEQLASLARRLHSSQGELCTKYGADYKYGR